jgi:hypothetical protein
MVTGVWNCAKATVATHRNKVKREAMRFIILSDLFWGTKLQKRWHLNKRNGAKLNKVNLVGKIG